MIPPLVERCPRCGRVGPAGQYRPVTADIGAGYVVECPACGHRFKLLGDPRLT